MPEFRATFVTGDSVYGNDPALRQSLQYKASSLRAGDQQRPAPELGGGIHPRPHVGRPVALNDFHTLSCGEGAKGPRLFDWAYLPLDAPEQAGFEQGLLVRRSLSEPDELAYYLVFAR